LCPSIVVITGRERAFVAAAAAAAAIGRAALVPPGTRQTIQHQPQSQLLIRAWPGRAGAPRVMEASRTHQRRADPEIFEFALVRKF